MDRVCSACGAIDQVPDHFDADKPCICAACYAAGARRGSARASRPAPKRAASVRPAARGPVSGMAPATVRRHLVGVRANLTAEEMDAICDYAAALDVTIAHVLETALRRGVRDIQDVAGVLV